FRDRAGKPAAAQVARRTSHGLAITTIDVAGEYSGMGGPMSREQTIASGYRLLGAIVEGPRGTIFVKFIGPANTVAENQKKFEQPPTIRSGRSSCVCRFPSLSPLP